MPCHTSLLIAFLTLTLLAPAQQAAEAHQPLVITWFGPGAVALPPTSEWKPELFTV